MTPRTGSIAVQWSSFYRQAVVRLLSLFNLVVAALGHLGWGRRHEPGSQEEGPEPLWAKRQLAPLRLLVEREGKFQQREGEPQPQPQRESQQEQQQTPCAFWPCLAARTSGLTVHGVRRSLHYMARRGRHSHPPQLHHCPRWSCCRRCPARSNGPRTSHAASSRPVRLTLATASRPAALTIRPCLPGVARTLHRNATAASPASSTSTSSCFHSSCSPSSLSPSSVSSSSSVSSYSPVLALRCAQMKIWGRHPEQLSAGFQGQLRALLEGAIGGGGSSGSSCANDDGGGVGRDSGGGSSSGINGGSRSCRLADYYVRRGCIELVLDLEAPNDAALTLVGAPAAAAGAGAVASQLVAASAVGVPYGNALASSTTSSGGVQSSSGDRGNSGTGGRVGGSGGQVRQGRVDMTTQEGADAVAGIVIRTTGVATAAVEASVVVTSSSRPPAAAGAIAPTAPPTGAGPSAATSSVLTVGQASDSIAAAAAAAAAAHGSVSGSAGGSRALEAVRAQAMGHATLTPAPHGPAIIYVTPRVVVAMPGQERPVRQAMTANAGIANDSLTVPPTEPTAEPEGTAAAVAAVGSSAAGTAVGGAACTQPQPQEPQQGAPAAPGITLRMQVNLPAIGALIGGSASASAVTSGASGVGAAAVAAANSIASAGAAAALPDAPALELLVRCGGRYIPICMREVPDAALTGGETDDAATITAGDGVEAIRDSAGMESVGPGATAALGCGPNGTVRRLPYGRRTCTFDVTLLEAPPLSAGVLLLDLRWCGRPAHVAPVLLLEDPVTAAELTAVARSWNGPAQELDGLLYDMGAWMRSMNSRHAAGAAATPASAARMAVTAGSAGSAGGSAGGRVVAAVLAGGGGGSSGRGGAPDPAYLPVLGASLLQFAHSHGLMAVAVQLQADMRGCGYTAAFRPLLRGRPAAGAPAHHEHLRLQQAPAQQRPRQQQAQQQMTPWRAQLAAASSSLAASLSATTPTAGASAAGPSRSGVAAKAAEPRRMAHASASSAGPEPLGRQVTWSDDEAGASARASARASAAVSGSGAAAAAMALTAGTQRSLAADIAHAMGLRRRCLTKVSPEWRRTFAALERTLYLRKGTAGEEASYSAFVDSYGSTVDCLYQLVNLLSLTELLLRCLVLAGGASSFPAVFHAGSATKYSYGFSSIGSPGSSNLLLTLQAGAPAALALIAALPSAIVRLSWLLLPLPAPRCLAPHAQLWRRACLALARLLLLLSPGLHSLATHPSGHDGLQLLVEGVLLPASCLLSPAAALLLAALSLPLHIAASCATTVAAAGTSGAAVAAVGSAVQAAALFRVLVVAALSLLTTLVCHVHLRLRFQLHGEDADARQEADRAAAAAAAEAKLGSKGGSQQLPVCGEMAK